MGSASARHLIDDVDGIAATQEKLRPALATVGRAGEIRSGLAAAVDHHDRVGMLELLRDLELHVHLPDHRRALDRTFDPAADEEITLLGDDERTIGCGLGGGRGVDRDRADDGNGRGDNEHDVVLGEHAWMSSPPAFWLILPARVVRGARFGARASSRSRTSSAHSNRTDEDGERVRLAQKRRGTAER